ncbi:MAG TPA: alpha-E domain-containing protein [Polyangiaceae bacterium]|nr:alpha-E domain-containing protein [Polyangiaceae bacterium]
MLLSSVAEAMFWSGRYIERAQALSRSIQAVERLSLDLPSKHSEGLSPLLPLVSSESNVVAKDIGQAGVLRALALDVENTSSVLGALKAARENLRHARVSAPPELWVALNNQYLQLSDAVEQPVPRVLDALSRVLEAGSRIKGVSESNMARDAAYSFLEIGVELERADMLLRVLKALLPSMTAKGWERAFDDVRWSGLLQALGVRSMFRQRHHHQTDLSILLDFVSVDASSPRSVVHCLRKVEGELRNLPRAGQASAAVTLATSSAFALAHAAHDDLPAAIESTLTALASVHSALVASYFPNLQAVSPVQAETESEAMQQGLDPFAHLLREHGEIESVLGVLDELASQAEGFQSVEKSELQCIVGYLAECGELGHHEKEEAILAPKLIEHGFDWYDGPVAAMRREHRHEHMFLSVLGQLGRQHSAWSAEDGRRFATDARALGHFLRSHMDHERRELFDLAARSLPDQVKQTLARAFVDFDARQEKDLAPARARMSALVRKYRT